MRDIYAGFKVYLTKEEWMVIHRYEEEKRDAEERRDAGEKKEKRRKFTRFDR